MSNTHYVFVDRKCPNCDGSGEIGGFDGLQICPECHGMGLIGSYEEASNIDISKINFVSAAASHLRRVREQRKISMGTLAKHFDWSLVHLSNLETGREQPTEAELQQIKEWLNEKDETSD